MHEEYMRQALDLAREAAVRRPGAFSDKPILENLS